MRGEKKKKNKLSRQIEISFDPNFFLDFRSILSVVLFLIREVVVGNSYLSYLLRIIKVRVIC